MTDLDRMIERINYIRKQGFITQNEAQDLKQLARSLATAKGVLGPKNRDTLNKRITDALNKKGKEAKEEGGLKPPSSGGGKPGGGKPGGGKPGGGKPGGEPGGGNNDKDSEWDRFRSIWGNPKFKNKTSDRKFIQEKLFKSKAITKENWRSIDPDIRKKLLQFLSDFNLSGDERKKLLGQTPGGGDGPGGGPGDGPDYSTRPGKAWVWDKKNKKWVKPPKPPKGDWAWDDDSGWVPRGGPDPDEDDEPDPDPGEPDDDEPDPGPGEPTVKGGGKKIDIPKPANRANYEFPGDAQRIGMPNIDRKITEEIERVTLRLIKTTKEFIEGGMDFFGIDYVAENEILGQDGNPYYPLPDYNSPGESDAGLAEDRAEEIKQLIDAVLSQGDKTSASYNYLEYLDLFELRYNGVGDPTFRFSIELTGSLIEDLTVLLVEEEFTES